MSKLRLMVLLIFVASRASAECMIMAYHKDQEPPRFELLSCRSAKEYVGELKMNHSNYKPEDLFANVTEKDLAIVVKASNRTGRHFMFGGGETSEWHYQGTCSDVPLNIEVELDFIQSCCESPLPTLYCVFPAKIESITTFEKSH